MQFYLDTSALVKLVVNEPESPALDRYLSEYPSGARFTAALARTELVRAIAPQQRLDSIEHARRVLGRLHLVPLSDRLLDNAATLVPHRLRTLDAIHLAAAMTAPDLRAIVTYDNMLADAAAAQGITVTSPRG
jgi:predicted nucleic acid-binding protein